MFSYLDGGDGLIGMAASGLGKIEIKALDKQLECGWRWIKEYVM